jgi:hypothetical protein
MEEEGRVETEMEGRGGRGREADDAAVEAAASALSVRVFSESLLSLLFLGFANLRLHASRISSGGEAKSDSEEAEENNSASADQREAECSRLRTRMPLRSEAREEKRWEEEAKGREAKRRQSGG